MSNVKLGWGMSSSGEMRHISKVENGKKCDCVCSDCGTSLIAKQGECQANHFAHSTQTTCQGMSALHKAAQQILEKAAFNNQRLLLPPLTGDEEEVDCCGVPHHQDWEVQDKDIVMGSAQQEVRFDSGRIIADVVVFNSEGDKTAVEIHVTNKKGEIDKQKYTALKQEVFEIDLSELPWDSNESVILDAVLLSAPRRWIFTNRANDPKHSAVKKLSETIIEINKEYYTSLDAAIKPFKETGRMFIGERLWPALEEVKYGESVFGKRMDGKSSNTPKVTGIIGGWTQVRGGWRTKGHVNETEVKVDILFLLPLENEAVERARAKCVTLIVCFYPDLFSPSGFDLKWVNIRHWLVKLENKAELDLNKKLEKEARRKVKSDEFTRQFGAWDDQKKFFYLAKKLGVPYPLQIGKVAPAWGVPWSVWKSAVWYYKLVQNQKKKVNVQSVASDEWLGQLFDWSIDEDRVEARAKNLWFWFKELEGLGYIKDVRGQNFTIEKELPNDFHPWAWIKKNES